MTQRRRSAGERVRLAEEQATRTAAEAVEHRFTFLAEVSRQLASSLDYPTTLASVARLAVPRVGDWCAVNILEADGTVRRLAVAVADPAKAELARELENNHPPDPSRRYGTAQVLRTGRPELYAEASDEVLHGIARDAEHLRVLRALGYRSAMIVPLRARGRLLGTLLFVLAETPRQYGPADLVLAEDLAGRCALAIDNARLYGEAQDAVRMRDEFLALASHDLRGPLTAIKGYAQLLLTVASEVGTPRSELLIKGLTGIEASASKMAGLIGELLDLAQLGLGRALDLKRSSTDLVALVQQLAAEHQQTTTQHQITVEAPEPRAVGYFDAARIERMLGNLLTNAISYSPSGGPVVIRVTREPGDGGPWAVVTVQDHGLGIPAADLPRLFEQFRRGGNVTARIAGTGIGLAGVRQVVEQHGGTISVRSREGEGTTFTVRLPLSEPPLLT